MTAPVTLHGIRNCDTVKKARAWLDARGIAYAFRDYKTAPVTLGELTSWSDQLGWEALLNRAGTTFRKLPEAERADLDADRALALMCAQPSMIKRPLLETASGLTLGFKQPLYEAVFAPAG